MNDGGQQVQPFQHNNYYTSSVWPELYIYKKGDHLLIPFPFLLETISSAVHRGGFEQASHFINWQVPLDYSAVDPIGHMRKQVEEWGYSPEKAVALQTAARIDLASVQEESGDGFRMVCCVTAGIGNRARAGKRRRTFPAYQCGTINTFLCIDSCLTPSAMVNAIITATEAKAAALQDLHVRDESGEFATGTTTDAIVIAVSQNRQEYPVHQFAGTATTIGNAIGRLVYDALYETVHNLGRG
ncbi:adenosylcobinamide amidohydrolase [Ectobacillus funiculus]|uniref:Adenosylcobinamide amidohydrolase n=1 Tax=Ectobacillus funiculus TaxID=137993 RepID=A0ABV5WCJ5_9BACI